MNTEENAANGFADPTGGKAGNEALRNGFNPDYSTRHYVNTSDPTHFAADPYMERALLGAIILDPPAMDGLEFLAPNDFFDAGHQNLFGRMRLFWNAGESFDATILSDRDMEVYTLCMECVATAQPTLVALDYAKRVKELSDKRKTLSVMGRAAEMSMNGSTFQAVNEFVAAEMEKISRGNLGDGWRVKRASGLVQPPQPREWLLEGLVFKGQVSMWYGPPGILKTLFLQNMCACMSLGRNWLMRYPGQPDDDSLVTFKATRPARVLWLDYDNGEFETEIRIRAALKAYDGLDSDNFLYMSESTPWLALDNEAHVRKVINLARANGVDVIVLDALGMILGGVDENSPEVAKVISSLKTIRAATGAAIIGVHHPSKAGAQTDRANTYNAAGSAKFSNFFEWTIELRRGEAAETIVAEVVKHRGWAKAEKFIASFDYNHFGATNPDLQHELETFRFYPAAVEDKKAARADALRGAILAALACGEELSQNQLVKAAMATYKAETGNGIGDKTVMGELVAMTAEGLLTKQGGEGGNKTILYSRKDA